MGTEIQGARARVARSLLRPRKDEYQHLVRRHVPKTVGEGQVRIPRIPVGTGDDNELARGDEPAKPFRETTAAGDRLHRAADCGFGHGVRPIGAE
jgi:hypothetical protein